VSDYVELSDTVAVVEELNLLPGKLPRRTKRNNVQISQGRQDRGGGEVLEAPNHHTDSCFAVDILHAGQHGPDGDGWVGPDLEVQGGSQDPG